MESVYYVFSEQFYFMRDEQCFLYFKTYLFCGRSRRDHLHLPLEIPKASKFPGTSYRATCLLCALSKHQSSYINI